jgi:hypothetical protein
MCYRAATRGNLAGRILQTNFFSMNPNKVVSPLSSELKGWEFKINSDFASFQFQERMVFVFNN